MSDALTVGPIGPGFEGSIPAMFVTCAPDGMPSVTYASALHYVIRRHGALPFQFFDKTREKATLRFPSWRRCCLAGMRQWRIVFSVLSAARVRAVAES